MLCWIGLGLVVLFVGWVLLQMKTSRPDGEYLPSVHPYRTMMQYVMTTRAESIVYYDIEVPADNLLDYIQDVRKRFHADVTHCLVAAAAVGLQENPEMNRFPIGRRLYQRHGNWVTFSMKRKKKNKKAKLATVKKEIPPDMTFEQLCSYLSEEIKVQRSGKETYHDKEYNLLTSLPRPILQFGVNLLKWMDYNNILPGSFIKGDALYTSIFMANLGSINMASAYHHLYEWGNCPLFIMAGKIEERPYVEDGKLKTRKVIPMRLTYDERIDDGLTASHGIESVRRVLEDPHTYLGCLKEDGSDHYKLGRPDELVPLAPTHEEPEEEEAEEVPTVETSFDEITKDFKEAKAESDEKDSSKPSTGKEDDSKSGTTPSGESAKKESTQDNATPATTESKETPSDNKDKKD
ncbi:MAG: hypothetical protein EP343_33315 [Deltaproteobacteria bacterium]|nr:MAG: hypothetical protein EP343_33315 [Deltaproteobacteria bacterium]